MKKFFNKYKLAMVCFVLMIVVAGYINYEYNPEREKNLGQTMYVNNQNPSNPDVVDVYKTEKEKETFQYAKADSAISVFKYDRDNMFSEMSENYKQIIANSSTDKTSVNEYQKKLEELIAKKNLIVMVENIIKSKGIEEVVIIPAKDDTLNVVLKSKNEIKKEQIAQVQQIVSEQFGIKANKLSITVKFD